MTPPPLPPPAGAAVPALSIVTPAFQEEANLPLLHERLAAALAQAVATWEWIVVDDGSTDGTSAAVARLAALDGRVRGLRLARNGGSHAAILRGFAAARGTAVLLLAADLQDPPESCPAMVDAWRRGARIVWAVRRRGGLGSPAARRAALTAAPGRLYHGLLRRWRGAAGLPPGGAGFVLVDRSVAAALAARQPAPVDVFAALGRLDRELTEPCATVVYERAPRRHGRSGWTLGKKVRFAVRSLAARG